MSRPRLHALYAILTVALLCCTSWGRPAARSTLDPQHPPARLRLTLSDGRGVELLQPSVSADTLLGDTLGPPEGLGWQHLRAAIPFSDISAVSVRRVNVPMTVLVVALATGGTVAIVSGVQHAVDESEKQSCNAPCVDC